MFRAGLTVSLASLVWTVAVGACAIAVGTAAGSLALGAFGAIGLLDGAGSLALVVHFRHSLRHDAISERLELIARRVVTLGIRGVAAGTVIASSIRLANHGVARTSVVGVVLAAVSIPVLGALAVAKRTIAARIPSTALKADAWLSGVGAALAGITLIGTALTAWIKWWWVDPIAAICVALFAFAQGVRLARMA